jgi:hypothetical protein
MFALALAMFAYLPARTMWRDWQERRWDRAAERRDHAQLTARLDNLREQVRLQAKWDAEHADRDWALVLGAIYGADFQRWEREVAS